MKQRNGSPALPREAIELTTYSQLDLYLAKFALGELGLVLLLGRHGTGKSEAVRRALFGPSSNEHGEDGDLRSILYVEGHMQPFGLYRQLWECRNKPVVLDDLDRLYADPACVRLLKPLCNTITTKRLHWLTNVTMNDGDVPASFTTTSDVILIANEWRSLNPNVRALEDRAIILHFDPPNSEVHRKVGQWFVDSEVYEFLGQFISAIPAVSMRHYCKGSQLRRAGLADWRNNLLQMAMPDSRLAWFMTVQHDPDLRSEQQRVDRFIAATRSCRATYFRIKARIAK